MSAEPFKKLYLGLVHYPITSKYGTTITTAVTNLDIHDIARTCTTYGVKRYFVINPLDSQIMLTERILEYWRGTSPAKRVPDRHNALQVVEIKTSIEKAIERINKLEGQDPIVVATSARESSSRISFSDFGKVLESGNQPVLLLFGTGYGLADEIMNNADYVLDPIKGRGDYNHLSVRSAVAIILDRLLGQQDL